MGKSLLIPNRSGHTSVVVRDLVRCGWNIESIPGNGKLPRNGLKLILKANGQELKLRLFAYKVTTSGRSRPHERRIEITTTYQSGLNPLRGFRDVVLGVDADTGKYVGVDSRRLKMGGSTHNASSFFDLEGLTVRTGELLINPRHVSNSHFQESIELHAFFDPSRLSEYLANQQEIHSGGYAFHGAFSGRLPLKSISWPNTSNLYRATGDALVLSSVRKARKSLPRIPHRLIASVEENDFTKLAHRKLTPAQLKEIQNICEEIGILGEQAVLKEERKRLIKLGFPGQAKRVERVSLWSVGEGYDILSFENDGITKRYLEVKATTGKGTVVDVSKTEWNAAKKFGKHYYLVRVINVRDLPKIFFIKDPIELERQGKVVKTAAGWRIELRAAIGFSD